MSTKRLLALCLVMWTALVAHPASSQRGPDVERAAAAVISALPPEWVIAERNTGEFPYGHHYCKKYRGITGTKLTIVGPRAVAVHWTTEAGEPRRSDVAVEAIELWFMPPSYRDRTFAWLCFHRPVQPIEVLTTDFVRVYGRATHRLQRREVYLREVLPKASSIQWPDSPATNPELISWPNWVQRVAAAAAGAYQEP